MVVVQPTNAIQSWGFYFRLLNIRARDSQATLVIDQSDHFVHPEGKFIEEMRLHKGTSAPSLVQPREGAPAI